MSQLGAPTRWFVLCVLLLNASVGNADGGADTEPAISPQDTVSPQDMVAQLVDTPVSRLEWGMLKIQRYLEEGFAIDPETLAPYSPRFYVNVEFEATAPRLVIEIGRTFPSLARDEAPELCRDYVNRVRILFNIDRVGRPIGKPWSTLAADFFLPPNTQVDAARADAIDALVTVEGLVASPISGVYAVCGAGLRDAKVRTLD